MFFFFFFFFRVTSQICTMYLFLHCILYFVVNQYDCIDLPCLVVLCCVSAVKNECFFFFFFFFSVVVLSPHHQLF
jgi:hypothetical protein